MPVEEHALWRFLADRRQTSFAALVLDSMLKSLDAEDHELADRLREIRRSEGECEPRGWEVVA